MDIGLQKSIEESLSPEQVEKYRNMVEKMHSNIDFEKNAIINNIPPPTHEALAYIEDSIRSGLLPEDLEYNEIELLKNTYGEKWYKKFNFSEEEMKNIK